jgi:hypothetical protein
MKKSIIIIMACITIIFLHGMDDLTPLSYQFDTTTVRLTKGCIYEVSGKAKIMVIGANEQWKLEDEKKTLKNDHFFSGDRCLLVGGINEKAGGIVIIKDKINGSLQYSDKQINHVLLTVREPFISMDRSIHTYEVVRRKQEGSKVWFEHQYLSGTHAIQEASMDLSQCYKEVLNYFCKHEYQPREEKRAIALPTLSADIGFPSILASQIAIMEIIDFIMSKPYAYSLIHLFVKTDYEYHLYKTLLETHVIKK